MLRNFTSLITAIALSLSLASFTAGCAVSGDELADEYADSESNASAPGKVDLWKSSDGQFRFRVVAGNGRILLSSEGYTSRTGALNGVLSVLENGVDPEMYQLNLTKAGKYNLRLVAKNHEIIAFTQAYASKSNAKRAINSCVSAITSYLDKREANTSGARVELLASDAGYRFNVHARNGQIVLSSEIYTTQAGAWNGAFAAQDAAARGAFELRTATDNRFYFVLKAENGQVVGVSQLYTTKASAQAGIESVTSVLATLDLI